jgi:hypothetical protein
MVGRTFCVVAVGENETMALMIMLSTTIALMIYRMMRLRREIFVIPIPALSYK